MFSARHMNELAKVLRIRMKVEPHNLVKQEAFKEILADIATMLERTSPRFNRDRFLRAATPEGQHDAEAKLYPFPVTTHRLPPKVQP